VKNGVKKQRKEKNKQSKLLAVDYSIKPSLIAWPVRQHTDRDDLVHIDPKKIRQKQLLCFGEQSISGGLFFRRIQAVEETQQTCCDVRIMEELLRSPEKILEELKMGKTYFPGTIFRNNPEFRMNTKHCIAYMYWETESRQWKYGWSWFDGTFSPRDRVAVMS